MSDFTRAAADSREFAERLLRDNDSVSSVVVLPIWDAAVSTKDLFEAVVVHRYDPPLPSEASRTAIQLHAALAKQMEAMWLTLAELISQQQRLQELPPCAPPLP